MFAKFFKKILLFNVAYTYSNLSRLFLRLFTGVMFLQLCVQQLLHFDELVPAFQGWLGMSPELSMSLLLVVELLCAMCIILGLLTRIAVLPPLIIMFIAENILFSQGPVTEQLFSFQPGYPVMFIGIFVYMLLAGPGKISLDYIIGVHLIDREDEDEAMEKA